MQKPKLHIIAGPTASGKTAVAIELAKKINGEVISADSMQIYKYMNIGTAKPSSEEIAEIPHHLLDVAEPSQQFSVADYSKLATEAILDIQYRSRTPILAGGTGFYINAIINGTEFDETEEGQHKKDTELRAAYTQLAIEKGPVFLHEKLQEIDPEYAKTIHPNNVKKVARALSFCQTTGMLFSAYNASQKKAEAKYELNFTILTMPRELLYKRINARVLTMWEAGLPEEVHWLLSEGYHPGLTAMQGIGYKETIPYLSGKQKKEDTISQIQQATRNYAKRQETWFRHQAKNAYRLDISELTPQEVIEKICSMST